jgi:hypothetical protein
MVFSNYCLIVLGDIEGAKAEITKISESEVNLLEAKGLIIATFQSVVSVSELNDYFKLNERNFILFQMNHDTYAAHVKDKNINRQLFEEIVKDDETRKGMGSKLVSDIIKSLRDNSVSMTTHSGFSSTNDTLTSTIEDDIKVFEEYVETLDEEEVKDLINNIIDKGWENLTDYDKKCLDFLTKK